MPRSCLKKGGKLEHPPSNINDIYNKIYSSLTFTEALTDKEDSEYRTKIDKTVKQMQKDIFDLLKTDTMPKVNRDAIIRCINFSWINDSKNNEDGMYGFNTVIYPLINELDVEQKARLNNINNDALSIRESNLNEMNNKFHEIVMHTKDLYKNLDDQLEYITAVLLAIFYFNKEGAFYDGLVDLCKRVHPFIENNPNYNYRDLNGFTAEENEFLNPLLMKFIVKLYSLKESKIETDEKGNFFDREVVKFCKGNQDLKISIKNYKKSPKIVFAKDVILTKNDKKKLTKQEEEEKKEYANKVGKLEKEKGEILESSLKQTKEKNIQKSGEVKEEKKEKKKSKKQRDREKKKEEKEKKQKEVEERKQKEEEHKDTEKTVTKIENELIDHFLGFIKMLAPKFIRQYGIEWESLKNSKTYTSFENDVNKKFNEEIFLPLAITQIATMLHMTKKLLFRLCKEIAGEMDKKLHILYDEKTKNLP